MADFVKYRVIAAAGAHFNPPFLLRLTEEQAAPRLHNLIHQGGKRSRIYEVARSVMFKLGEEIEVAGDVSKRQLAAMVPDGDLETAVEDGEGESGTEGTDPDADPDTESDTPNADPSGGTPDLDAPSA